MKYIEFAHFHNAAIQIQFLKLLDVQYHNWFSLSPLCYSIDEHFGRWNGLKLTKIWLKKFLPTHVSLYDRTYITTTPKVPLSITVDLAVFSLNYVFRNTFQIYIEILPELRTSWMWIQVSFSLKPRVRNFDRNSTPTELPTRSEPKNRRGQNEKNVNKFGSICLEWFRLIRSTPTNLNFSNVWVRSASDLKNLLREEFC